MNIDDILNAISNVFGVPTQKISIQEDNHCIIQGDEATPIVINLLHPLFLKLNFLNKLTFLGCYFKKEKNEIFLSFNIKKVHFANCTFLDQVRVGIFEGDVEFNNTHFHNNVYFFRSVFKGSFNLFHSTFYQGVSFIDCSFQPPIGIEKEKNDRTTVFLDNDFKGQFQIECSIFHNKVKFEQLNFDDYVLITEQSVDYQSIMEGNPKIKDSTNPTFLNDVEFREIQAKKDISFSHIIFKGDVTFFQIQTEGILLFDQNLYEKNILLFSNIQCSEIQFLGTSFAKNPDLRLKQPNKIKSLIFISCNFFQPFSLPIVDSSSILLDFRNSTFKENADFESKIFFNVNFSQAKFEKNADFDYATFIENANFQKARFLESASFYGAKFDNTPNFAQSSFQKELNLVNTNLSFDHKDVKAKILQTHSNDNQNKKSLGFIINDFRDSFRIFKNTLSKEGNFLDASNYHRVELYCKEIELDSKNPPILSKDWIDKWQLRLYRHTSDHHTDLLKIISWVIVTIGIFGLLLFACKYGTDLETFIKNHSKNTFVALFDTSFIKQSKIIGLAYPLGFCALFWKWSRIAFFSSITLSMTLISYKYILGVGSFLTSKASTNPIENLLLILYTLVMILLLFSLQKTARKNSIVPN